MDAVYIDHSLITSFFLDDHPHHLQTKADVASFLKNHGIYFCSIETIFKACEALIAEISHAKNQGLLGKNFAIEKEVVHKIHGFIERLGVKIIFSNNAYIFSKILSLQSEYKIGFDIAFHTAIMLEHKISLIAAYNDGYAVLFSEGILKRYEAH